MFYAEIQNGHEAITKEETSYRVIPIVANITSEDVSDNYQLIKREIMDLLKRESNNRIDTYESDGKEDMGLGDET